MLAKTVKKLSKYPVESMLALTPDNRLEPDGEMKEPIKERADENTDKNRLCQTYAPLVCS